MPTKSFHSRIFLRHRSLLLWAFGWPLLLVAALILDVGASAEKSAVLPLLVMVVVTVAAAFFLATVQKELLSTAMCYLWPDLRAGLLDTQLRWGLVTVGLGMGGVWALPQMRVFISTDLGVVWSVLCLAVMAYALTVLLVLRWRYAAFMPTNGVLMVIVIWKLVGGLSTHDELVLFSQPAIWTAGAALAVFAVVGQARSRRLHRRLVESPFASVADIWNGPKMANFRRGARGGVCHGSGRQAVAWWLDSLLARVRKTAGVSPVAAQVWEAQYLGWAAVLPRQARTIWLKIVSLFVAFIALGWLDARMTVRADGLAHGFFVGVLVMVPMCFVSAPALHLRAFGPGRLAGRPDLLRAGYLNAGLMLAQGLALNVLLVVVARALSGVVAGMAPAGSEWQLVLVPWYLVGSAAFVLPCQLLAVMIWRRRPPCGLVPMMGVAAFYPYHLAFSLFERSSAVLPVALIGLCLWLAAGVVWNWRVMRADLA